MKVLKKLLKLLGHKKWPRGLKVLLKISSSVLVSWNSSVFEHVQKTIRVKKKEA